MAHAQPSTCGIQIAEKSPGVAIPEIDPVDPGSSLSNLEDVHFGMNSTAFDAKVTKKSLAGLGPRILDISKRGGRTAEDSWRHLGMVRLKISCKNCKEEMDDYGVRAEYSAAAKAAVVYQGAVEIGKFDVLDSFRLHDLPCLNCDEEQLQLHQLSAKRPATPDFKDYFEKFNVKPVKAGKDLFPAGAKIGGKAMAGLPRYQGPTKLDCEGLQYGIRWSKTALEHVVNRKQGKVHFQLDGMGDISAILAKAGDYSHNVTSTELRYVKKNWNRFAQYTVFYNGYTATDLAVMVQPPW